jgi:hypothetical protein
VYPVIVDVTSTGAGEAELLGLVRALRDLPDVEHVRVRCGAPPGPGSVTAVLFVRAGSAPLAEHRACAGIAGVLPRSGRVQVTVSRFGVGLAPPPEPVAQPATT